MRDPQTKRVVGWMMFVPLTLALVVAASEIWGDPIALIMALWCGVLLSLVLIAGDCNQPPKE